MNHIQSFQFAVRSMRSGKGEQGKPQMKCRFMNANSFPFAVNPSPLPPVCQSKFYIRFKLKNVWTFCCKTRKHQNKTKQNKIKMEIFHVFKWIDMCHTHFIIDYGLYGNLKAMPIPIQSLLISNKCKELSVFVVSEHRAPFLEPSWKCKYFQKELKQ